MDDYCTHFTYLTPKGQGSSCQDSGPAQIPKSNFSPLQLLPLHWKYLSRLEGLSVRDAKEGSPTPSGSLDQDI